MGLQCWPIRIYIPQSTVCGFERFPKAKVIQNLNGGLEQTKVVVLDLQSKPEKVVVRGTDER